MLSELLNLTSSSGSSSGLGALSGILKRQPSSLGSSTTSDLMSFFLGGGMSGASIPGTNPIFPALPFTHLEACQLFSSKNPKMANLCTNFLQNFLAIPLFWCQKLAPIRATFQGIGGLDFTGTYGSPKDNTTMRILEAVQDVLGVDEASIERLRAETDETQVALSRLEYEIQVGRLSLLVYTVLTSLLLACCFVALIAGSLDTGAFGSYSRGAGNSPWFGPFPLVDIFLKLRLRRECGGSMDEEDLSTARKLESGSEQVRMLGDYQICSEGHARDGREGYPVV